MAFFLGTPNDAGILPRALEVLFNTVGEQQYEANDLKPRYFCGVSRLEESDIKKEEEKKERIFKITSDLGSTFSQSTMVIIIVHVTVMDITKLWSELDEMCREISVYQ